VVLAVYVANHGLSGLWLDIPLGISLVVSGFFLAPRVRATGASSIAGIAGQKYGSAFGAVIAVLVLLAEFAWFALLTLAGASLVSGATGLGETAGIVVTAAAFSIYTSLGGQRAVIRTDLAQLALLMVFGLGIPAVITLFRGMNPRPGMLSFPTGPGMGPMRVFSLVLMMGLPGLVGGDVYSRLLSAITPSDAAKASVLAGLVKLLAAACVAVIALGGNGEGLDAALRSLLPPVLYHAAAFSILMAIMSSADSVLLTGATVLHTDLLPGLGFSPRIVVAGVAVVGTVLALAAGNVVKVMEWSYTVFSAGAPLPLMAALLLANPPSRAAANLSVALGGGAAVVLKLMNAGNGFLWAIGISFGILAVSVALNRDRRTV
jgi:Na+/proline symporter